MTTIAESNARTLAAIDTLAPYFQKRVRGWCTEMVNSKIPPLIYCGRRTMEEQTALYSLGRSAPGKVVTKARAGESYHNYGLAFDWVPLKISTKNPDLYVADWNDETAFRLGEHVGQSFELAAISWETGHLQASEYASWRDILRIKVEERMSVFAKPTATRRVKMRRP
jgi:peptidoglycan L-alanyl-D-glutamate endopeptidase CwlK